MTTTRKKRPRDPVQFAKLIGDIATGQTEDREPLPLPDDIERPRVLRQLVLAHTQKLGYSAEEMCKLFGLFTSESDGVLPASEQEPTPKLKLVVNN